MALKFTEIDTTFPQYGFVERLLHEAFPYEERRGDAEQRANADIDTDFHCVLICDDDRPVGLINYWTFDGWAYIEHFAMSPSVRGRGYGAEALNMLRQQLDMPLILEVEMPRDDLSRRRIGFYTRQGLSLWEDIPYLQPPYHAGGCAVDMLLMADEALPKSKHNEIVRALHQKVYPHSRSMYSS